MTIAQPQIRLAPITSGLLLRNPRILLGGAHQPTLLRYLEGWPKRWQGQRTFRIEFIQDDQELAQFGDNAFDLAVIQAPAAQQRHDTIANLVRIARQGLITRR